MMEKCKDQRTRKDMESCLDSTCGSVFGDTAPTRKPVIDRGCEIGQNCQKCLKTNDWSYCKDKYADCRNSSFKTVHAAYFAVFGLAAFLNIVL
ncbi:uncharacterized protein LOC142338630 isoform X2 [Convolutriloba macropyga]